MLSRMQNEHSVTSWLKELQNGDNDAAGRLWERFHLRLVTRAKARLDASPVRMADADDVVQEAFQSFFRRAQQHQFPELTDRDDLWSLLLTITDRKALNEIRASRAQKRGSGQVRGESVFGRLDSDEVAGIDRMADSSPTPDDAVMVMESCEQLLSLLNSEQRQIAICKLEGRTNKEIAQRLDCAVATVERRLQLIRRIWSESAIDAAGDGD